jgi:hypothetical protein
MAQLWGILDMTQLDLIAAWLALEFHQCRIENMMPEKRAKLLAQALELINLVHSS